MQFKQFLHKWDKCMKQVTKSSQYFWQCKNISLLHNIVAIQTSSHTLFIRKVSTLKLSQESITFQCQTVVSNKHTYLLIVWTKYDVKHQLPKSGNSRREDCRVKSAIWTNLLALNYILNLNSGAIDNLMSIQLSLFPYWKHDLNLFFQVSWIVGISMRNFSFKGQVVSEKKFTVKENAFWWILRALNLCKMVKSRSKYKISTCVLSSPTTHTYTK